ncbi:MAG: c-type cytochrome biogenesis protein CcsB [Anaerolineae bacterium]|nr:c-type cytochrome biogenesis protein CcsB [Anaerolineae bacterium]
MVALIVAYFCLLVAGIAYIVHLLWGRRIIGYGATATSFLGLVALSVGLILRGIESGHWPLASTYEFSLVFVWSIVLVYLLLERVMGTRAGGAFALPIAFLLCTYARFGIPDSAQAPQPLLPALRSLWLQLHAGTAAIAYGAFAVACGGGVMVLAGEFTSRRRGTWDAGLPWLQLSDRFTYWAVAFGYPFMSLAILTGAIWAQMAWGRYWGWDVKETWSLIIWLIYTLFLHLRAISGWRGRPVAVLSVVGFVVVLFTFLGVGWLARRVGLESLHVY